MNFGIWHSRISRGYRSTRKCCMSPRPI